MKKTQALVLASLAATAILSSSPAWPSSRPDTQVSQIRDAAASEAVWAEDLAVTREVARSLAVAMARKDVRLGLRDALRDSRWLDHKVVLQEIAATPAGRRLMAAAARAAGVSPAEMRATLAALPDLDFYVPFLEHRTTWKGTSEILVGVAFVSDTPRLTAYDVMGSSHELRLADGIPAAPLLILHPAEKKLPRSDIASHATDVIQSREESAVGQKLAENHTNSGPGYYLTHYNIQIGEGWWGSLEMEFRSAYYSSGNYPYYFQFHTRTASPVNEDQGYNVNLFLNSYPDYSVVPFGSVFIMAVWEMDGGDLSLNQDDYYGERQYPPYPTNGTIHDYYQGSTRSAWIGITAR